MTRRNGHSITISLSRQEGKEAKSSYTLKAEAEGFSDNYSGTCREEFFWNPCEIVRVIVRATATTIYVNTFEAAL